MNIYIIAIMQELDMHGLIIHVLVIPFSVLHKIIDRFPHNLYMGILLMRVSKLSTKHRTNFIHE